MVLLRYRFSAAMSLGYTHPTDEWRLLCLRQAVPLGVRSEAGAWERGILIWGENRLF